MSYQDKRKESLLSHNDSVASSSSGKSMKYILITGGVMSGIGKGILASGVGAVLKASGLHITSIKIDPYLNIDAGTFSPYEHGEVFVLDDGGEVDLDLGNYERFLNVTLTRDNNITTGKIYRSVTDKERRGDYLGKTVQVVPHITDEIQNWVMDVAKIPVDGSDEQPEVCIIELGGTTGDIEGMPFYEAFRQFSHKVRRENFCKFHVSLILQPRSTTDDKTKPTQQTVAEVRKLGLAPDFLVCRSEAPIQESTKEKISNFCDVDKEFVISLPDLPSTYDVPLALLEQNVLELLGRRLKLGYLEASQESKNLLIHLANQKSLCEGDVTIALVGKYTLYTKDAYASIIKALEHASYACRRRLNLIYVEGCELELNTKETDFEKYEAAWNKVKSAHGILIPGGFGKRGTSGKMEAIRWARLNKIPMLGICLGLQLAAIEFARNVLNLHNANSTELDENCEIKIVIDMPEHNQGQLGGTMRLGKRKTIFKTENSKLRKFYGGQQEIEERHRHRYEVNPEYLKVLEDAGLRFVAQDETGKRQEILELDDHPYFVAVQYHPEYLSKPLAPSPPFFGLLKAATEKS